MNWISEVVRPKIKTLFKRESPENLWIKCPETGQLVFYKDVEANHFVIPGSNYHMRMSATARMKSKSCTAATSGTPSTVPLPSMIASSSPVFAFAAFRRSL